MHIYLVKLHKITDYLIPYAIVVLAIDFIIHFFFPIIHSQYGIVFIILQILSLAVFAIDLGFKFHRASSWPNFLKTSWFDILALFPFFLVFRMFETLGLVGELSGAVSDVQGAVGTGSDIERRTHLERFIQPLLKSPRFFKILHFYNKP